MVGGEEGVHPGKGWPQALRAAQWSRILTLTWLTRVERVADTHLRGAGAEGLLLGWSCVGGEMSCGHPGSCLLLPRPT